VPEATTYAFAIVDPNGRTRVIITEATTLGEAIGLAEKLIAAWEHHREEVVEVERVNERVWKVGDSQLAIVQRPKTEQVMM
jgi:alkyl hydroperoxide reductase subunit AhpC